MKKYISTLFALLWSFGAQAAPAADHPLVGRYGGSELVGYFNKDYDETDVIEAPFFGADHSPDNGWRRLEGHIQLYYYKLPSGRSSLEVLRNYQASLKSKGFVELFSCSTSDGSCYMKRTGHVSTTGPYDFANALDASPELPRYKGDYIRNYFQTNGRYLLARLARPQGDVYASIALGEGNRESLAIVRVIETKAMDSGKIAFVGADEMRRTIGATGRIALYGIQFDFDKAMVKPESKPTLDEIAALLNSDSAMRIAVVGHTDAQGTAAYNMDLSRRRAASVAAALTGEYGIDASRITPRGAGATQPLASNDNEEGRAKNRRVELVRE
ncbi:MAG: OmpA family protein [Rudaea sp.]